MAQILKIKSRRSLNLESFKEIEKAYTEGIYSDTPANRKLGRSGMTYKAWETKIKGKEEEENLIGKEINSIISKSTTLKEASGKRLDAIVKYANPNLSEGQLEYFNSLSDEDKRKGIAKAYIRSAELKGTPEEVANQLDEIIEDALSDLPEEKKTEKEDNSLDTGKASNIEKVSKEYKELVSKYNSGDKSVLKKLNDAERYLDLPETKDKNLLSKQLTVVEELMSGKYKNDSIKDHFLHNRVVFDYDKVKVGGVISDVIEEKNGDLYMFVTFDRPVKVNGSIERGTGFTDGDETFNFGNLIMVPKKDKDNVSKKEVKTEEESKSKSKKLSKEEKEVRKYLDDLSEESDSDDDAYEKAKAISKIYNSDSLSKVIKVENLFEDLEEESDPDYSSRKIAREINKIMMSTDKE